MKFLKLLPLALVFLITSNLQAQSADWISCRSTSPLLDDLTTTLLPTDVLGPMPSSAFTTAGSVSYVPNLEYLITLRGTVAGDSLGNSIIATSVDGSFDPSMYGLTAGDTFDIIPIAYDLQQIKEIIQSVLFDSTLTFGICCQVVD